MNEGLVEIWYSLRSSARLEIEVQNQIFLHQTSYIKKSFNAMTSGGVSQ